MGQCFSAPAVGSVHGRETEEKYRAKWNDIGYENDQRQRIKANLSGGVTATTVCVCVGAFLIVHVLGDSIGHDVCRRT